MFRPSRVFLFFALCVLVHAPAGFAQTIGTTSGAVEGRVLDTTGAVLAGVIVTAAGDSLLVASEKTSAQDDSYRFFRWVPSHLQHRLESPGHRNVARRAGETCREDQSGVDPARGVIAAFVRLQFTYLSHTADQSLYATRAGAVASGISCRSVPPSLMKILVGASNEPFV